MIPTIDIYNPWSTLRKTRQKPAFERGMDPLRRPWLIAKAGISFTMESEFNPDSFGTRGDQA